MSFARGGRPGLLGTIARTAVISGTAQVTSNAINRRARLRWEQESAAQEAPPPPAATPPPPPPPAAAPAGGNQLADQLLRLADLRNAGVLTDDEFAAAKARLLT